MTIAAMMYCDCEKDEHESDFVMPGFRFHPTEQELIDFYLRRKVEGKRFNIELITFVDLYRYDPWELPALAAIGEKEWFFYVPRDRKYRIGNRPNRVTTSGYWKATGADKMILSDNMKPIGLKKTLVFYAGKAPRGIRTNWIMNEYRLPEHDTSQLLKAEISICKVYRRGGSGWSPEVIQSDQKQYRKHPSSSRMTPIEHNSRANHEMKAMDRAAGNYGTAMAAMSTVSELGEGDDGVSAFICQSDALLPTAEQFSPCSLALVLPEEHMAPFTVMPRSLGAVSSMRLGWNPH